MRFQISAVLDFPLEKVRLEIQDIDLNFKAPFSRNYYDALGEGSRTKLRSVEDFLEYRTDDQDGDVCAEYPIPSHIADAVRIQVPPEMAVTGTPYCLFNAGRAGSIAPIHFDWDFGWVLQACVRGKKKLLIFPPDAGWLIAPVVNTSSYCIPRMSEPDRLALVRMLEGAEIELTEGEALIFPALWWHGVRYDESCFALSIRFGAPRRLRPLALLPRSWLLQRIAWLFFGEGREEEARRVVGAALRLYFSFHEDWLKRYNVMNGFYREVLQRHGCHEGVEYLTNDALNVELNAASDVLADMYGSVNQDDMVDQNDDIEVEEEHIFAAYRDVLPKDFRKDVTRFAISRKQGLRPRRGLLRL